MARKSAPRRTPQFAHDLRRRASDAFGLALAVWVAMSIYSALGSFIDAAHALLMVAWVAGMPLLFLRRHPRLTRAYGVYAVSFIVVSQLSRLVLGGCFLTTIARAFWSRAPSGGSAAHEWFTVRFSESIFRLSPSHRSITLASEALVLVTAVGILVHVRRARRA